MDIPSDSSWTMRKILGLRKLCQPLIRYHVGNGANTFLWLDNWHILGPLYAKFGERVVTNLGRALWAKVATIIDQGDWCWPKLGNQSIQAIMAPTPPSLRPNLTVEDSVSWIPHPSAIFIVRSAWNAIRKRYPIQPWHKIIWTGNAVPRWSFNLWLVVLQRLSTKDSIWLIRTWFWIPSNLVEVLDWYGVQRFPKHKEKRKAISEESRPMQILAVFMVIFVGCYMEFHP
ncbi:uncharacterized protein LOC131298685 [Rhododendron vialii]|uniref:uncharacterized protein LOC131298685 n=1 Tax=Rhododendron vialii TaxID=182163 RepID=UPI00266024E3|nr:uncharacterized protein LOC131298685 [Rhododendron vialii]